MLSIKRKYEKKLKYKSAEDLNAAVEGYVDCMVDANKPLTVTGLALYLECPKKWIMDYPNKDKFRDVMEHAKLLCENYAEIAAYTAKNPAAAIFILKNYGWSEKLDLKTNIQNITLSDEQLSRIIARRTKRIQVPSEE